MSTGVVPEVAGSDIESLHPRPSESNPHAELCGATGSAPKCPVIDLEEELIATPCAKKTWTADDDLVSTEKHERLQPLKNRLAYLQSLKHLGPLYTRLAFFSPYASMICKRTPSEIHLS